MATHFSILAWRNPWTEDYIAWRVIVHSESEVKLLSCVQLFATPWTAAHQPPLSMDFPGKNSGLSCRFLLQGIFLTQGSNPGLLYCWQILYHLSHQGRTKLI